MTHPLRAIKNNARPQWYKINNAADGDTVEVLIYGEIGDSWWGDSIPAADFVRDLAAIDDDSPINFHVHSPGGDVFDGLAIATAIRTHPAKTVAYVDGLAASAASYIAIAADETVMATGSQMMIHDAWGLAMGNAADMQKMADDLDKVSGNIASLYAGKAGGEPQEWRDAMLAETWYNADEAVTAGLADRVDTGKKADTKNRFDLSIFAHAGRSAAPDPSFPGRARAHQPPAEPEETTNPTPEGADMASDVFISGVRQRLGINAEAQLDENGLLAALDEALAEQNESTTEVTAVAGTTLVENSVLDQLRSDAEAGRAARDQQLADHRAAVVDNAVNTGRIAPARRQDWLNTLEADPGAEATLNSLAPGLVPVQAKGYTGGVQEATDDDMDLTAARNAAGWGEGS